jgi:hypothetical protein
MIIQDINNLDCLMKPGLIQNMALKIGLENCPTNLFALCKCHSGKKLEPTPKALALL